MFRNLKNPSFCNLVFHKLVKNGFGNKAASAWALFGTQGKEMKIKELPTC